MDASRLRQFAGRTCEGFAGFSPQRRLEGITQRDLVGRREIPNEAFSAAPSWPIVDCASFEAKARAPSMGDIAFSRASGRASIFFSSAVTLSSYRPMSPSSSNVRASLVVWGVFVASIECLLLKQDREYRIEVSIHAARQCFQAVHITLGILFFRAGVRAAFKQGLVIRFISPLPSSARIFVCVVVRRIQQHDGRRGGQCRSIRRV